MSPLISLREIESKYSQKAEFHEVIATYESFVGNYTRASKYFGDEQAESKSQPSQDFLPVDAISEIVSATKYKQAVFINEAHHVPAHRALTTRLLRAFWNNGFRYFAAEALSDDKSLNGRKYPLFGVSGYYVNEPYFGDLVRQALSMGFTVVPYEFRGSCSPDDSPVRCQNQREQGQAQNLYERILKVDPSAKILVHAGYGHTAKIGKDDWIPMAKYFWQLTSIEPYSIDQTHYIATEVARPTAFKSREGQYWAGSTKNFDMAVVHPRERESTERPSWASLDGYRRP